MSADPRAACIVGVARRTWHRDDPDVVAAGGQAPEPLDMWHDVARTAADDAGVPGALAALESIDVVYSQSWQYDDAVGRLAGRLGASPQRGRYSGIGGSVPHVLVTEVARDIAAGDLDLALVVGAEALATVRTLKKAGEKPHWSFRPAERRPFPMDMEFDPSEISHAVFEAYLTFALFDNARRAHLGRELDAHRAVVGRGDVAHDRRGGRQPACLVPGGAGGRRDRRGICRQSDGGVPLHETHDLHHGHRHGGGPRHRFGREG